MLEPISRTPPPSPDPCDPSHADPSASPSPAALLAKIQAAGLPDSTMTRLSVVMAQAAKELGPAVSLKGLGLPISLPIGSLLKPFLTKLSALPSSELDGQMERLRELVNFVADAPRSAE